MTTWVRSIIGIGAATAVCLGCGNAPPQIADGDPRADAEPPVVHEEFVSDLGDADVVDSLAVAPGLGWVIATAKGSNQLIVLDAATGEELRRVGRSGAGAGELDQPNGIAVAGAVVLVVERDNARVQVFTLPELEPLGSFGEDVLNRPYGIAVLATGDPLEVWVTDSIKLTDEELVSPPRSSQEIERFEVSIGPDGISAVHLGTSGDSKGEGAIWMVESIGIDAANDVLLVADEHALRRHLKVFRPDGRFSGRVVGEGAFEAEPEGLALWPCGDGGYWIAVDQLPDRTVFEVFDRVSLGWIGAFRGETTANTDGIGLTSEPIGSMSAGALYAVHRDRAVAAFDLRKIAAALDLSCPSGP